MENRFGFTLMELILVICIFSILALIATPNLLEQRTNLKLKATARDIYSAFQQARFEAVEKNATVVVRFSTGAYAAQGNIGGYRLFVDDGAGGGTADNLVQDGSESSLAIIDMPGEVSLTSAVFSDGSTTTDKVGFTGQGLPADSYSGTVQLRTRSRWYRINLSVAGNVQMQQSDDGANWS